ncbi:hypothetical protein H8959_015269 [Pygathrix nigripes]
MNVRRTGACKQLHGEWPCSSSVHACQQPTSIYSSSGPYPPRLLLWDSSTAPLHQLSLYVLLDLQEECAGDNPEEEVPPITGHLGLIGLIGPPWDRERREIWAFLALRAALGRGTDADCEVGEALLPLWDCPSSLQLSVVLWVPSAVVPRQPTLEGQSLRDPPTQLQPGRFLLRMVKLKSGGGRGMSWGLPRERSRPQGWDYQGLSHALL